MGNGYGGRVSGGKRGERLRVGIRGRVKGGKNGEGLRVGMGKRERC